MLQLNKQIDDHITKSLSAIDRAFATLGKDAIGAMISEIDALNIEGPTVEEYYCEFESNYESLMDGFHSESSCQNIETFTIKLQNFVRVYTGNWKDTKPIKENITQKKSTTDENSGGFLFRFVA